MRLLDRYLLRELITPLAFCLGGFLIFWVGFDLLSNITDLQNAHLNAGQIAWYYFLRLPELLVIVLPIGLLLALLYALTNHARHNELTAIRAAGVSMWRLALPYLSVGLALSLVLLVVNEFWAPHGTAAAAALLDKRKAKIQQADPKQALRKVFLKNGRANRFWAMDFNQRTYEMHDVHVAWQQPDGTFRVFAAARGIRSNGQWVFFNVSQHTDVTNRMLPVNRTLTNQVAMPEFTETPEQFLSEIKISDQLQRWQKDRAELPIADILTYLKFHPQLEPTEYAKLYTKLHGRIAAPWTCIVVVLIALPFGAASGRRNVAVGVASGIFICFAYFICLQLGLALGAGGYLWPWLAAWLPNLLFGGTALFFTLRIR